MCDLGDTENEYHFVFLLSFVLETHFCSMTEMMDMNDAQRLKLLLKKRHLNWHLIKECMGAQEEILISVMSG